MRSEFSWGLLSSFTVTLVASATQTFEIIKNVRREGGVAGAGVGLSLLPFVAIYFIVGVMMLFFKKSETFAKGLLLSALVLFFLMIVISSGCLGI